MKIFLTIIFLVVCIALTVIVLMQEGKAAGLGSIGGIGDSYWGKNKSRSMEGNLVRFTKFLAVAFLLIALLLNMIPDSSSSSSTPTATTVETESAAGTVQTESAAGTVQTESAAGTVQTESAAVTAETESAAGTAQTEA